MVKVVNDRSNRGRPWLVLDKATGVVHGSYAKRGDAESARKNVNSSRKRKPSGRPA
jgi:hypothetical protein